ncbi:PIN-like domain-containing protein [Curtobacterium sp. RRHDQ66]|uniref:PIN-like domain-containing protein n=1 Tax=Curtobacterium guangdongense TaxID=3413380 RepID=UPI003BEF6CEC
MRDVFRAYYAPAGQELDALWTEGIIVLDTNTLLNFFRYTPSTRDEFLSVLESLQESLWIPHQVGLEFQRRRLEVISNTADAFSKIKASVDSAKNTVNNKLNEYKHHPSLNRNELTKELDTLFERFSAQVDAQAEQHEVWIAGDGDPEKTFFRISDLYSQRVGQGFTGEELDAIEEGGKRRYEDKVPPGYKDANKTNGNEYGDLIIWKEILRLGETMKKPVIFVTDDAKEDWWLIERGKTQGPRPELIDEYWAAAEQRIHLYEPLQFLKHAKDRTQLPVSDDSLDEVKEVSDGKERALRILHDRHHQLERQRGHLQARLERLESERFHDDDNQVGFADLIAMRRAEHLLEEQRSSLLNTADTLPLPPGALDDPEAREEYIRNRHDRMARQSELDKQLASLRAQRRALENRANHNSSAADPRSRMMARNIESVEEELREVSLALDELEN